MVKDGSTGLHTALKEKIQATEYRISVCWSQQMGQLGLFSLILFFFIFKYRIETMKEGIRVFKKWIERFATVLQERILNTQVDSFQFFTQSNLIYA